MLAADLPHRFNIPFANAAVAPYIRTIPEASQIGVETGAASLTTGFPPANFETLGAGGVPPFGKDFNGIIKQITQWSQWSAAGGPVGYDSDFATGIGGYPKGAVISSTTFGYLWISLVDANTSDPDAGGANWSPVSLLGGATTGDAKITFKTTADPGWILANDGSIGNASSSATTRANADCAALFAVIWNNISNSFAAVQNSAGTPVARGASAAADFAANRRIVVPKQLSRALLVAGAGSGLTSYALGSIFGNESNLILQTNLPSLSLAVATTLTNPTITVGNQSQFQITGLQPGGNAPVNVYLPGSGSLGFSASIASSAATGTAATGGSGVALDVRQPVAGWNLMIKL